MAICRCRAARAIGKAILRLFATGNTAAIPVQHSDVGCGSQLGHPERERQRPQNPFYLPLERLRSAAALGRFRTWGREGM
jgi:hypothetical protein